MRPGWPSMFRTYWNNEELYNARFQNGWYITGDRARKDADGYFWFIGRADDVINTAGHLVGPFEVESALIEHPAVAEAGVIGKPDPVAMEIVKAFVSLKDGYEPTDKLRRELIGFAREKLGPGVAPREIDFIDVAAEDALRQDHAPPAQGARARPARRRHRARWKRTEALLTRGPTTTPPPLPTRSGSRRSATASSPSRSRCSSLRSPCRTSSGPRSLAHALRHALAIVLRLRPQLRHHRHHVDQPSRTVQGHRALDHTLLVLNLLILLCVAFMPFPTAVLADNLRDADHRQTATLLYGGTYTVTAVFFVLLWLYVSSDRGLLAGHLSPARIRTRTLRYLPGPLVYGVALGLALITPWLTLAIHVALAVLYLLPLND